jgi:hypothetical protein
VASSSNIDAPTAAWLLGPYPGFVLIVAEGFTDTHSQQNLRLKKLRQPTAKVEKLNGKRDLLSL